MSAKGSGPSATRPLPMSLKSDGGLALPVMTIFRPKWAVTASKRSKNFWRAAEIVKICGAMAVLLVRHLTLHARGAPFFLHRDVHRRFPPVPRRPPRPPHMHPRPPHHPLPSLPPPPLHLLPCPL